MRLTTKVHDRDAAGLTYVYPVVSRRAGGVSLGINLNPNNACNWRCVYCQVPGLTRGKAPTIDLVQLERELEQMLDAIVNGDYMERHVPENARRLNDIAFSGNGEPTSSPQFEESVALAIDVLSRFSPAAPVKPIVISNGSLVHKADVARGLSHLARGAGELWFKLDSGTDAGKERINDDRTGMDRTRRNLEAAVRLVPTWIQTMMLAWKGEAPSEEECEAYLEILRGVRETQAADDPGGLRGVLLYGLARKSYQPEAPLLSPLPAAWMNAFAERIRALGIEVRVSL